MENLNVFNITHIEWINIMLTILIPLLVAIGLHYLMFVVLVRLFNRTKKYESRKNVGKLKISSLLCFVVIALKTSFTILGLTHSLQYTDYILNVLLILSLAWLLTCFVGIGKNLILSRYDFHREDNLDARRIYTQFKILERIVNFIIIVVAIALVLMTFDSIRKIGISLLASAGIAGVIIGFAAQKLLATILAGLQIAITQPIRLDDVVIVENEWGWIEEINLTYVVVRIWDKRRLVLPTTYFIEKPFQNWTRKSSDILGTVYIYADYTLPVDELRKELTRIVQNDDNWDRKVNVLQVTNASDKIMEIRALVSAENSPSAWNLRVNVREKLIAFMQKNYPGSLPRTRISVDKDK